MDRRNLRLIAGSAALVLGACCGATGLFLGYATSATNSYAWLLHGWAVWSLAAVTLLAASLLLGPKHTRILAALVILALVIAGGNPAQRLFTGPIDWSVKPLARGVDLSGNADLCEPSEKQLVLDRRTHGSRETMWRLYSHYGFCEMKPSEMKYWLHKLADVNDPRAMVLLGNYAEFDGHVEEAAMWFRRAASLGHDANAELRKELKKRVH
jgi:TPR repeat protein